MHLCLQHPTLGYYARQRSHSHGSILGSKGDFITSPEISQVFGEVRFSIFSMDRGNWLMQLAQLLGVWFVSQWQAQGSAPKTRLIELGPGRGTLMQDLLRVCSLPNLGL